MENFSMTRIGKNPLPESSTLHSEQGVTMRETYLSQRVSSLKPSGIRRFFDIAATMQDVISLGIGEPDFDTPRPVVEAGIRSLQQGRTHYTSNAGTLELRRALTANLERLYGVQYDPANEVVITVGGSEALYLTATALLDPGDEVIIPTPCFVSYQAEVFLAGGVPVEIPCRMEDNFDVDPVRIEAAITPRTKAILLGFPNNPTGAVATRERLLEIARLAEKYDLIVISDEIYDRLVYGGHRHVCFPTLPNMRGRTVLLGGFSKDYAMTGWRIGYACAPAPILQGLLRVHQYTVMSAPTIAQDAAVVAIQDEDESVMAMVEEYDRRRRMLVPELNRIGLPTFEPKGAFYAFPKVSVTGLDDETFATRLLQEEKVAVVPGNSFGAGGEGFCRISYATAYEKIEEALRRIERFVNRL
jgi:aminotransferase